MAIADLAMEAKRVLALRDGVLDMSLITQKTREYAEDVALEPAVADFARDGECVVEARAGLLGTREVDA